MTTYEIYGKVVKINPPRKGYAMLTGKEDLLQALVEAYVMEKGTREFYAQAASKSTAAEAKRSFAELEEFKAFSAKAPATVSEGGLPVKDLEKRIEQFAVKNEKDALSLALNIEAKAYNFYKGLAAKAQDVQTRVIFEDMMAQETEHLNQINAMKKKLSP